MNPRPALLALALILTSALPAAAQCYADYKAKQDNPLRLHYGVVELPASACGDARAAAGHLAPRLQQDGWILLQIMSTFGPEGLDARREDAGRFFLRY
ncbi:hypothetical protein [Pararhodobacter sp. SW119]|uniref:hypothetical protein n=1 Tax=Pararhodobacter sp. SW119 TaxID=2780075 RepID=UPI001ADF1E55|nr:hypothetical protein [Pararhodobacter sp. SW119]